MYFFTAKIKKTLGKICNFNKIVTIVYKKLKIAKIASGLLIFLRILRGVKVHFCVFFTGIAVCKFRYKPTEQDW